MCSVPTERTGFRYRLDPSPRQAAALGRWAGCARALYNAALEQRRTAYRMGQRATWAAQDAELSDAKRAHPWLAEPHSDVCQQALRDLDRAFARFFRGEGGYPRFRRKGRERFRIQNRAKGQIAVRRLSRKVGEVRIPKLGWVRFRWSRQPAGEIKHLTVSCDALGWHVSLCCERETAAAATNIGAPVGLDRGVAAVVATSDGRTYAMSGLPPGQAERLRRLGRKAGRQETARRHRPNGQRRRSARHQRTLDAIAKLRAREARIRRDFLHKLTTDLAKSHGMVAIESLDVAALTGSARGSVDEPGTNVRAKAALNRAILAQGWGELRRQLAYKCERHGGQLVDDVPARDTSRRCAECGEIDAASRSGRRFTCTACGHTDDADINAARVILARALSGHEDGGRAARRSAGSRRRRPRPRTANHRQAAA
jgi:putative transposase